MGKIKKLIALFLCTVMLISVFAGCGKNKNAQETVANATEERITCGEWLDLLASNFGAVNSTTEEPYFSNITKENDMFAKIQTLVEFGVIDKSEKLNLESYVTYKEMALDTLNLMGTDIVADYLETSKNLKEKDLLKFAKDKKIVSKTNNSYATKGEAQTAVDTAVNLYVNRPIIEKQDAKLKKSVKDLRRNDVSYENGNVTINDETKVSVGDIIILPATDEYPMGLARKVSAVNGKVLTTTEPELSEVYEKIDISATVVPKLSDITPVVQGVTIEEYSDIEGLSNSNTEANVITLSSNAHVMPLAKNNEGLSISIPVNITKGKLSVDANWDALTLEMSKQNTKLDKNNIPFAYDKNGNQYTQKYTGGLEIKGKITVENLKFDVDVDWSVTDVIKSVSISPKFTTKIDLAIKGKAEGEELSVFKTAVPIGTTGVWVDCIFVIKVGVNGDITVKTKMVSESCTTYKKGKGITTVNNKNDFNNSAQISGNLTVGVGPKAVLTVLGIDIADAALVLGLGAKGTVKATQGSTELPCIDIKAYGPTASFTIGKDKNTILNKLGVSAEIKLIDLDGALVKPVWNTTYHWESNYGWMKSSECKGNKKKEENSSTNSSASSAPQSSTNSATSSASQNNSSTKPNTNNSQNSSGAKFNLIVSNTPYKSLSRVENGVLVAKNNSNRYGMINTSGKVLVDFQYGDFELYDDGYVTFEAREFYNSKGEYLLSELIANYSNGIICVQNAPTDAPTISFRTSPNKEIFSIENCRYVSPFNKNGIAVVNYWDDYNNSILKNIVINKSGKTVYELSCDDEHYSTFNGKIGDDGWVPLTTNYNSEILTFENYLTKSKVRLDVFKEYGAESHGVKFKYIVAEETRVLTDGNLAVLEVNNTCHLYDIKNNKEIVSYPTIHLNRNSKNNLIESKDGKWGYIDRNGNIKKLYDDATNFCNGYAMVKINDKLYVIDENFNVVSDGVEGDSAAELSNNYFSIKRGENYYLASFK